VLSEQTVQKRAERDEPPSYWQETAVRGVLSSELPLTSDVVVIGGGIVGTALGYWLARTGMDTILLERTAPAQEATGRNGGLVSIGLAESYPAAIARLGHETAHAILQLTRENQVLLRHVLEEEDIACDYHKPGSIHLALDEKHLTALAQEATALRADGVAVYLLDRTQLQAHVSTPLAAAILGGRFKPESAVIHPVRLVGGLLQAAQRHGLRFCVASAQHLIAHQNSVTIQTTQGMLRASCVIVAINAWTGELLPQLASSITPVRGQMLAYAPLRPVFATGMSTALTATGEYWQQCGDGAIVLGGCRAAAPDQDVGMRVNQPTAEVQTALEAVFPRLFPELDGLQVVRRWAGMMAFTPDYLPIVDRVPEMPGVFVIGGFCGHGMPFALRLGQALVEALTMQTWPSTLLPFRLSRATLMAH